MNISVLPSPGSRVNARINESLGFREYLTLYQETFGMIVSLDLFV